MIRYLLAPLAAAALLLTGALYYNGQVCPGSTPALSRQVESVCRALETLSCRDAAALTPLHVVLDNGIRVVMLPTPFEEGEFSLRLVVPRGYGDVPDELRVAAQLSLDIVWEQGLLGRDSDGLTAWLCSAGVEAFAKVDPHLARLEVSAAREAAPDVVALMRSLLQQRSLTNRGVTKVLRKTAQAIRERKLHKANDWDRYFTSLNLPQVPYLGHMTAIGDVAQVKGQAERFLEALLGDPAAMAIVVVGDFEAAAMTALLQERVGSLPLRQGGADASLWVERQCPALQPAGVTFESVSLDNLKDDLIHITVPLKLDVDSASIFEVELTAALVEERLRSALLQASGNSRGLDAGYELPCYPRLSPAWLVIQYRSGTDGADEATATVLQELAQLTQSGVSAEQFHKVLRDQLAADTYWRSSNEFWLNSLTNYTLWGWPLTALFNERPTNGYSVQQANRALSYTFDLDAYKVIHATSE